MFQVRSALPVASARPGAGVAGGPAGAAGHSGRVGMHDSHKVLITVHLWSTWLEVAIEQADEARRAREEMTRLRSEAKEFAARLGAEFRASVVAVAASAHALDAAPGDTARTAPAVRSSGGV